MTRPDAYPGPDPLDVVRAADYIDRIKPDVGTPVSRSSWDTQAPITSTNASDRRSDSDRGAPRTNQADPNSQTYTVETGQPIEGFVQPPQSVRRVVGAAATTAEAQYDLGKPTGASAGVPRETQRRTPGSDITRARRPDMPDARRRGAQDGEVVEGTMEMRRRLSRHVMADQDRFAIDGTDKAEQDRQFDVAVHERAERLQPGEEGLMIDLTNRTVTIVHRPPEERSYDVKLTSPLADGSPLNDIPTEEKVDVVAAILSSGQGDRVADGLTKAEVLGRCAEAIETWREENPQPEGSERGSGPVTVEHLRDSIAALMGRRQSEPGDPGKQYNEIPSLLEGEREAILDALGGDAETYKGLYPQLHTALRRAIKQDLTVSQALERMVTDAEAQRDDDEPRVYDVNTSDEPRPELRVVSVGPGLRTNLGREMLLTLLSAAAPAMVAGKAFVAIRGLTDGSVPVLKMAIDECTRTKTPIIVSDSAAVAPELTDKWPRAILPVGSNEAAKIAQASGMTMRSDRTGVNITIGNSEGANFKPADPNKPESTNAGNSKSVSWTTTKGPGQRVRQADIEDGPGPGEMAVTGTNGEDGIYDTTTGEWLRPFPTPELSIPDEVIHAVKGAPAEAIKQAMREGRPLDHATGMLAVSAFVNQDLTPPDVMRMEAAIRTPAQRRTHMELLISHRSRQRVMVADKVQVLRYSRPHTIERICSEQHHILWNTWKERYDKGQTGSTFEEWTRVQTGGLHLSPELNEDDRRRWRNWWGV